jgi:nucleoside-diphosphate-sugar epimerase
MSDPFKNKRIAIIGGAGFIGHHMALKYTELGAEVSIIDGLQVNNLLSFSSSSNLSLNRDFYVGFINKRLDLMRKAHVSLYIQDVRDYHATSHLLERIQPNVIIHLAAVSHADRSNKDPYSTFDHSLRTLENTLDFARYHVNNGLEHFIYFSSSMVYGHFTEGTVTEDTQCEPLGIYGALKFAGEKLVISYQQVFDLPYTIIRPSALYGERCVSRRVAQIFVENALQGKDITVSGDGGDRVDFTYVDDLVRGVEQAILSDSAKNQIFNLTYGQSRSIGELAEIVKTYFPESKVVYQPKDKLTPDRGTLSVEKARSLIGYEPSFPLEKGMEKYIQWYRTMKDFE